VPRRRWRGASLACLALATQAVALQAALAFQAQSTSPAEPAGDHTPRLIPRTPQQREQRFIAQHRIILNVGVADSAGKPLTELKQEDFTLYDNDQPRKLVSFRAVQGSAAGAHVILVLDAVNLFTHQLRSMEKEIERYLQQENQPLPVPFSIGVFAGYGIAPGPATRDRGALLADLASQAADLHASGCITQLDRSNMTTPFTKGNMGGMRAESPQELACKNERFVESVNALSGLAHKEMEIPGRTILIWLGPGWPMLTDRAFAPDTPELKQSFFSQVVSLSRALREAQITVDAVASPDLSIDPKTPNVRDFNFFEGVSSEDQASAAHLGLHVLAHQTGGSITTDTKDVAAQIGACVADVQSYYVLAFDSPAAAGFGEFHTLAVKVDKPGLEVRTNTLYYAEQ
jgi:VWFA-related protein